MHKAANTLSAKTHKYEFKWRVLYLYTFLMSIPYYEFEFSFTDIFHPVTEIKIYR